MRRNELAANLVLCNRSGEEIGMLEDMEVGISDLHRVMFKITEAKTDDLIDLQPLVCGQRCVTSHFYLCLTCPVTNSRSGHENYYRNSNVLKLVSSYSGSQF